MNQIHIYIYISKNRKPSNKRAQKLFIIDSTIMLQPYEKSLGLHIYIHKRNIHEEIEIMGGYD